MEKHVAYFDVSAEELVACLRIVFKDRAFRIVPTTVEDLISLDWEPDCIPTREDCAEMLNDYFVFEAVESI